MSQNKHSSIYHPIVDGYSDASTPTVSAISPVANVDGIVYQIIADAYSASTPAGTLTIQGSLDYLPGTGTTVLNSGHWVNLTTVPASVTLSGAGSVLASITGLQVPYIRATWTPTAAATINLYLNTKSV